MHHIYLIPGFFGFSNLGDVHYFRAVREQLRSRFAYYGVEVTIPGVSTVPTGSLRRRAQCLLDTIAKHDGHRADTIHLVGHSTGGLDARLISSTARDLTQSVYLDDVRKKISTVVCLSTPHYGTPLANFFSTLYGKQLLYFITLLVFVGLWRKPIAVAGTLMGLGFRVLDLMGLGETLVRQLTSQLLRDFSPQREREVRRFLDSILDDVSLMTQLTPAAMDVLTHVIEPLSDVRYVSYATASPAPVQMLVRSRVRDLLTPFEVLLYSTLYTLTAGREHGYDYSSTTNYPVLRGCRGVPFTIDPSTNDGVVPTKSQLWGEVRGVLLADHLDVVGHYLRGKNEVQDGADWFRSGARFDRPQFEALWNDVADVMLRKA